MDKPSEPIHGPTEPIHRCSSPVTHPRRTAGIRPLASGCGHPPLGSGLRLLGFGHYCRFKNSLHCRILNRQWHIGSDEGLTSLPVLKNRHWSSGNSVGSLLHPAVSSWTTLLVRSPNRQWCLLQECRFLAQASSVEQAYIVGSWLKSVVLSKPTLSVCC